MLRPSDFHAAAARKNSLFWAGVRYKTLHKGEGKEDTGLEDVGRWKVRLAGFTSDGIYWDCTRDLGLAITKPIRFRRTPQSSDKQDSGSHTPSKAGMAQEWEQCAHSFL